MASFISCTYISSNAQYTINELQIQYIYTWLVYTYICLPTRDLSCVFNNQILKNIQFEQLIAVCTVGTSSGRFSRTAFDNVQLQITRCAFKNNLYF